MVTKGRDRIKSAPRSVPEPANVLWRRLDLPGHDAATFREMEGGAELRGMAVFQDEGGPTALHYTVRCDAGCRTTEGTVHGWSGARPVDLRMVRSTSGAW